MSKSQPVGGTVPVAGSAAEKERISIYLDKTVLDYFRGKSRYWNDLANKALFEYIERRRPKRRAK